MRWLRISVMLISFLLPVQFVHAENDAHVFILNLNKPVAGMTFALFEDPLCTKPLENEYGENLLLTTDETGKAETKLSEQHFYMKQTETIPGWYQEKKMIPVTSDEIHIEPHPVSYVFSEKKDGEGISSHLQILNEKREVIADWNADKQPSEPYLFNQKVNLESGKTYILHDPDESQWEIAEDVCFQIPSYYEKNNLQSVVINRKSYGSVSILTETSEHSVSDVSVKFFLDEKGEKAAYDIYGKSETLITGKDGTVKANLVPGIYYVKLTDLNDSYYLDSELYPFTVISGTLIRTQVKLNPVLVSVSMKDPDGKNVNGKMVLSENGREQEITSSTLNLKRNTDYILKEKNYPSGYHAGKEVLFHVPEQNEGIIEQSILMQPFDVCGNIRDVENGKLIEGGTFQILNQVGEEVSRFNKGTVRTNDLHDCSVYTIHCLSMPEGYLIPDDYKLEIGKEGNFNFTVYCTPYVRFSANIIDSSDGKTVSETRWTLYKDSNCTEVLRDVYGNLIQDTNERHSIQNGTYYFRISSADFNYYQDKQTYVIHADHAVNPELVFETALTKADIRIRVQDPDGRKINKTKLEVMDTKGNSIGEFDSHGDDLLGQMKLRKELKPGDNLYLLIKETSGLYTWKEKRTLIEIPSEKPDEIPIVTLILNPYVSLDIEEAGEENKTEGSTYVLFKDEDCSVPATDIHEDKTESTTDKKGNVHWDLRSGVYWLKETGTSVNAYLYEMPVKVLLDPQVKWHEKINFSTIRPVIHFSTIDTQGNPVKGGIYDVYDTKGNKLHSFQSGGTVELKGEWLKPGGTLVFHETKSASGYLKQNTDIRYTLSTAVPDKIPEIRVHYLEKTYHANSKHRKNQKFSPAEQKNNLTWTLPFIALSTICIILVLKKISILLKKKSKTFDSFLH